MAQRNQAATNLVTRLSVPAIFRAHCLLILALAAIYAGSQLLSYLTGHGRMFGLLSLFDMQEEQSIPNVLSTAGLLAASLTAWLIVHVNPMGNPRVARGWRVVAAILLFLAIDEGAGMHDRLAGVGQAAFDTHGIFFIGWILPYLLLLGITGLVLLPVALSMPSRTRLRLIVAGAIYIGAAMGMEMIEAAMFDNAAGGAALMAADLNATISSPAMIAVVGIEETGEMIGVALALRALLLHLEATAALGGYAMTATPLAEKVMPVTTALSASAPERVAAATL